ncbi:MAG: hypothetical protein KA479_00230 [Saprospiraceae bacterium]|nr:hypothetical protein [Saprospiraceae bacterium]
MTYRILITFFTTIALAFLAGEWLPWWTIVFVAGVVVFLTGLKPLPAFLMTFTAGFFLWAGLSFWINHLNESILSAQIGELFNGISPLFLIAISGILGGLAAGLGGLTGSSLRQVLRKNSLD